MKNWKILISIKFPLKDIQIASFFIAQRERVGVERTCKKISYFPRKQFFRLLVKFSTVFHRIT
jgi:hypothetical protein